MSRIRWLFVIARNSSFTYKGQAVDVKRVGRELGVRYVLEGSVRKGGGRVRITAQLIEAETGAYLWADRFDGSLEDIFDLQDQVATSVAGIIEPALQVAEIRRSSERPTGDPSAYDLYLRALPAFWSVTKESMHEALDLLERAIERDPNYGPALGQAAVCYWHLARTWGEDPEPNQQKCIDRAQQALRVAGSDPAVTANAGLALAGCDEDIGAMLALLDRSLTLNPSYGRGWYVRAILRVWAGQPEAAIEDIQTSLRLNPRDRFAMPLLILGIAYFLTGRFDEAVANLLSVIQEGPGYPNPYRLLAACYAHMGRLEEARATIDRLRSLTPAVIGSAAMLRDPEHRELLLSGLRLAMGEDK